MANIISFLTNLLHKIGLGPRLTQEEFDALPKVEKPGIEPRKGKIDQEPLLAYEEGHLVMVIDHVFDGVPSWVEWDAQRQVVSVVHVAGDIDEAEVKVKSEHVEILKQAQKLLLVSNVNEPGNDNKEKIMHYVSFLSRT